MNRLLRPILQAALTVALIAWLVSRIDIAQAGAALHALDFARFAFAAVLIAVVIGPLYAMRWGAVAAALGVPVPFRRAYGLVLVGWFVNQFVPGGVGGDVMRAWATRAESTGWETALQIVLLDRVVALVSTVVIVAAGWPLLDPWLTAPTSRAAVQVLMLACMGSLLLLLVLDRLGLRRALPMLAPLERLARSARALFISRHGLAAIGIGMVGHLGLGAIVWLLAAAMQLPLPAGPLLVILPLVMLITTIPVSIAGWGLREGVMIVALGLLGVAAPEAFALSVLFGFALLVAALPGGVIWFKVVPRRRASPAGDRSQPSPRP